MSSNHALDSITATVVHDMPIIVENGRRLQSVFGAPAKSLVKKDKVHGEWQGKSISFNRTWGQHTFTDEEVEKLLANESITFTTKTKGGKVTTVTGKLADQTFKNQKYVGFKMDK